MRQCVYSCLFERRQCLLISLEAVVVAQKLHKTAEGQRYPGPFRFCDEDEDEDKSEYEI